jgi:hypothetical protein
VQANRGDKRQPAQDPWSVAHDLEARWAVAAKRASHRITSLVRRTQQHDYRMSSGFEHDAAHWYALLPLPLPLRDQHGWNRHSQLCLDSVMATRRVYGTVCS